MLNTLLLIISIIINAQVSTQEYIIGGLSSNIVDYPYQVAIVQNEQLWCSGSILSLRKVLTSANCVISSISHLKIHAGTSFWTRPRSVHNVVNYIMHGSDESTDLAILVVDDPFIFDMTRQPINLYSSDYLSTLPGTLGNVTSWNIANTDDASSQLMSVKVSTIDRASCNEAYHDISGINIINGQFCVAVHGDQPYQGSTGSPMVSDGYQVGIVSIGFGPPEYPTIFIDVVHYINWIRTHLDD